MIPTTKHLLDLYMSQNLHLCFLFVPQLQNGTPACMSGKSYLPHYTLSLQSFLECISDIPLPSSIGLTGFVTNPTAFELNYSWPRFEIFKSLPLGFSHTLIHLHFLLNFVAVSTSSQEKRKMGISKPILLELHYFYVACYIIDLLFNYDMLHHCL